MSGALPGTEEETLTVILCGILPANPTTGEKPIYGDCKLCKRPHHMCPECGSYCEQGYGLAGGGIGGYVACTVCDYFYKEQDDGGGDDVVRNPG